MVKFCYRCKKVFPIETKKCPICGDERLMRFCPNCRQMVPEDAIACPSCGDVDITVADCTIDRKKGNNRLRYITIFAVVFICIGVLLVQNFKNRSAIQQLDGDDRIAFDAITINIHIFKNPESVRVLGGYIKESTNDIPGEIAYLRVSAENSLGGTSSGYYLFKADHEFYLDYTDTINKDSIFYKKCNSENELDIVKINKALEEYWGK